MHHKRHFSKAYSAALDVVYGRKNVDNSGRLLTECNTRNLICAIVTHFSKTSYSASFLNIDTRRASISMYTLPVFFSGAQKQEPGYDSLRSDTQNKIKARHEANSCYTSKIPIPSSLLMQHYVTTSTSHTKRQK